MILDKELFEYTEAFLQNSQFSLEVETLANIVARRRQELLEVLVQYGCQILTPRFRKLLKDDPAKHWDNVNEPLSRDLPVSIERVLHIFGHVRINGIFLVAIKHSIYGALDR